MTISLRRSHPPVAGLVLAACGQNGPGSGAPSPRPTTTPSAPAQAVRALQACFGPAPAGWAGAARASLPTTQFEPAAVTAAADRVYGPYQTAAGERGIASVDLGSGALTRIFSDPAGAGYTGAVSASPPWVAWVRATGMNGFGPWTLEARDLDTGERLTVATGTAGLPNPGTPAMRGTELAWVQPTSVDLTARAAELRVVDLATRRQSTLDSGAVGPPVFAGPYLVWTRAGAGGQAMLQAVDAATLLPAALPERLRQQTGITALAGSATSLFWNTDAHHGTAWRMDRDQLTTFTVDEQHRLQYFGLAGHFLAWQSGRPAGLVMDLDTGGGYEMPGVLAGSDAAIVMAVPLGASNPKSGAPGSTVRVLAGAPAIPGCGR